MSIQFIPEPCTKYFGYGMFAGIIVFLIIYYIVSWYIDWRERKKNPPVNEIHDASSSKEINECVKQETIEYVG